MDIDDGMEKQFDLLRRLVLGPAAGSRGALVGGGGAARHQAGRVTRRRPTNETELER